MRKKFYYKVNKWLLLLILSVGYSICNIQPALADSKTSGINNSNKFSEALQQQIEITGTVTDAQTGDPLPGVNIVVQGTTQGTTTDMDGNYTIEAPADATLVFSFVGYQERRVNLDGREEINISLRQAVTELEEVVAIGYGTQRKSDLTGSVSSIPQEEIETESANSLAEAIQGKSAGIYVTQGSGQPGQGADITVRGATSINGLNPLWIVDGVRMGTGKNFNIKDVKSVEILKDAASSAIYGAQAAGGVVLVTTKRGAEAEDMQIDFTAKYGQREAVELYDLLETQNFIQAKRAIGVDAPRWDNTSQLPNTDWIDVKFRSAQEQEYNLSLSGSSENTNYYISGNYKREDGIVIDNYFERFSLRINSDYQIADNFKVGESLYGWKSFTNPENGGGFPFRSVPTMKKYNPENEMGGWGMHPPGGYYEGTNPLMQQMAHHNDNNDYALRGNVYAQWDILESLQFKTTFKGAFGTWNNSHFQEAWALGALSHPQAEFSKSFGDWQNYMANFVLTYDKSFGNHNLTAMAGYEALKNESTDVNASTSEFPVPVAQSFNLSTRTERSAGGGIGIGRTLSQFGRISYNYDRRYLLQANIRRDGSDKFGPQNKWGVFPSVSAGWRISEESFMQNIDFISNLKLRGGYGVLGSDAIGQFLYETTYTSLNVHSFADERYSGWGINKFPNRSVKWEEVKQTDIGVDMGFFDNSLTFTFDWYKKETEDMLYQVRLPVSSGIGGHNSSPQDVPINLGQIDNKGVEFTLNYQNQTGDFTYSFGGNASFNENEVKQLGVNNIPIRSGGAGRTWNSSISITETGSPMGMFYGYVVDGIFESDQAVEQLNNQLPEGEFYQSAQTGAGDLRYRDIASTNEAGEVIMEPDGKITAADKTHIGNPWPEIVYGFNGSVEYKGFDLRFNFHGVAGNDIYNGAMAYTHNIYGDYNTTSEVFGASYFNGNDLTDQPRLGFFDEEGNYVKDPNGNYQNVSSYFVQDGSYLKLRNLQIGYSLPSAILNSINMQHARIYISGQNLFTITDYSGIDPELAGNVKSRGIDNISIYPHTRLIAVGLELGF